MIMLAIFCSIVFVIMTIISIFQCKIYNTLKSTFNIDEHKQFEHYFQMSVIFSILSIISIVTVIYRS